MDLCIDRRKLRSYPHFASPVSAVQLDLEVFTKYIFPATRRWHSIRRKRANRCLFDGGVVYGNFVS